MGPRHDSEGQRALMIRIFREDRRIRVIATHVGRHNVCWSAYHKQATGHGFMYWTDLPDDFFDDLVS